MSTEFLEAISEQAVYLASRVDTRPHVAPASTFGSSLDLLKSLSTAIASLDAQRCERITAGRATHDVGKWDSGDSAGSVVNNSESRVPTQNRI